MNVRALAADILNETLEGKGQSHLLLRKALSARPAPTSQEKNFLITLVRGTVKSVPELDERLGTVSAVPVRKLKPYLRTVLRMSLFQLFHLSGVPASAVCDEAVRLVRARGMNGLCGFTNGVLRSAARKTDWPPLSEHAANGCPEWLWKRLIRSFGREEAFRVAAAWKEAPAACLRVNRLRLTTAQAAEKLEMSGISVKRHPLCPDVLTLLSGALPDLSGGEWFPQDAAAALCVALAPVCPGDRILDICGAPGGKTLHAAERLLRLEEQRRLEGPCRTGCVLSCDISEKKTALIREAALRAGLPNILVRTHDATVYDPEKEAAFDLVIADLPCSGLGVIGRKPEIPYRMDDAHIRELAALQQRILAQAVRYVKPGGHLLFSTCTITEEENRGGCDTLSAAGFVPEAFPVPEGAGDVLKTLLRDAPKGQLLLLPGRAENDGFFISLWKRPELSGNAAPDPAAEAAKKGDV